MLVADSAGAEASLGGNNMLEIYITKRKKHGLINTQKEKCVKHTGKAEKLKSTVLCVLTRRDWISTAKPSSIYCVQLRLCKYLP